MFQIHWRSLITGATGHGEAVFTKEQAQQIVDQLNRENKGVLVQWYEPAEQSVHLTDSSWRKLMALLNLPPSSDNANR